MTIRTKYTLIIVGIFILEILPVPFSSIYSLYAIRKRPNWLPNAIDRLYAENPTGDGQVIDFVSLVDTNFKRIQTKCTITLVIMFTIDLLVPVVIPTALYVVRKRPVWFKNLITQLYFDKLAPLELNQTADSGIKTISAEDMGKLEQRLAELDEKNRQTAKLMALKNNRRLING
jgi:hypothetical protein